MYRSPPDLRASFRERRPRVFSSEFGRPMKSRRSCSSSPSGVRLRRDVSVKKHGLPRVKVMDGSESGRRFCSSSAKDLAAGREEKMSVDLVHPVNATCPSNGKPNQRGDVGDLYRHHATKDGGDWTTTRTDPFWRIFFRSANLFCGSWRCFLIESLSLWAEVFAAWWARRSWWTKDAWVIVWWPWFGVEGRGTVDGGI